MLSYRFFFQTYIQERIMDDHTQKSRKDGKLQYVGQCLFRNKFRKFSSTHLATLLVSWLAVIKIFKT